jgi:hypothetical protein
MTRRSAPPSPDVARGSQPRYGALFLHGKGWFIASAPNRRSLGFARPDIRFIGSSAGSTIMHKQ